MINLVTFANTLLAGPSLTRYTCSHCGIVIYFTPETDEIPHHVNCCGQPECECRCLPEEYEP